MMTQCRLEAVIDEFNFSGTLSRTQLEQAVEHSDVLEDDRDVDALIDEAVDADVLAVRYDARDYSVEVRPNRPMAFEVTR